MIRILAAAVMLIAANSRGDQYVYGTNLNLTGQSGWSAYSGGDTAFPTFSGYSYAGTNFIDASVPVSLGAGVWRLYLNVLDYDLSTVASLPGYAGTSSQTLNDRDENRYWSYGITFTNAAPITNFVVRFTKAVPPAETGRLLFFGAFFTSNAISSVNRDGFLIDYTYPTNYDTSAPVPGNIIRDASFETGSVNGWGISKIGREQTFLDLLSTNAAHSGATSIKLPADGGAGFSVLSRIYTVATNKAHTLSAWARSSSSNNWASIRVLNVTDPPSGQSNRQDVSGALLVGTNWTRVSVTNVVLLAYPSSEFNVALTAGAFHGGDVYFDDIQLEEGPSATTYAPARNVEIGLSTGLPGNIFTNGGSPSITVRMVNHAAYTTNVTVDWEIHNTGLSIVSTGAVAMTAGASSKATNTISPGYIGLGPFRVSAWIRGKDKSEDELSFVVIPAMRSGDAEQSKFGSHIDWFDWQLAINQRLGIKYTRALSTAQFFRWVNAEPTEGSFVWGDTEVLRPAARGIRIMANLGENVPAWAMRTYFTVTNVSGIGFAVGENVVSGTATGKVSYVLVSTNYTGHALQLSNVVGSFATSQSITGLTSSTRASVLSAVDQAPGLDKWWKFATNVVGHYGTNIYAWEVWNEPDQDTSELPNRDGHMEFYAEILRIGANAIKQANPSAKVVAMGGVLSTTHVTDVLGRLDTNTLAKIDAISVHLYDPNGSLAGGHKTNVADVYSKPVWNTETGAWDKGQYLGANAVVRYEGEPILPYTEAEWRYNGQREVPAWISRNLLQSIGGGLSRWFYYDSRQGGAGPATFTSHPTILEFDDSVRTKAAAVAGIASLIDFTTGAGFVTMPNTNLFATLFADGTNSLAGLWSSDSLRRTVTLAGISSGAVTVFDVFGTAVQSNTLAIISGRSPVIIRATGVAHTNLSTALSGASVSTITDSVAPTPSVVYGPRGIVSSGADVKFRWLAQDDGLMPSAASPDAMLYSDKLSGYDSDFSAWSGSVARTVRGIPDGNYSLQVKAKDASGNVSSVVEREFQVGDSDPVLLVLVEPTARGYCGPVFDRWLAAITRRGWSVVVREIPRWNGSYLSNDWTSLNIQSNEVRRFNPDAILKVGKTAPLLGGGHALDGHEVRCYENHSWLGCTNITFTDVTDFSSIMVGNVGGIVTGLATNVPGDGKPDNMSGAFAIPVSTIDASGLTSAAGVFGSGYLIGQAYQPAIDEGSALTNYLEACIAYHDGERTTPATGHIASDGNWLNYSTITATNLSVTWTVSVGTAVAGSNWGFVYDSCELQDLGPKWITSGGVAAFIRQAYVCKSYQMENFNGVGAYRRRLFPGFWPRPLALVCGWGMGTFGTDAFWIATVSDTTVADSIRSSVVRHSGGGALTAPFEKMIIAGDITLPVDAVTWSRPSRANVGTLSIQ